jgi:ketosteroid isomerase-like protein
MEVPSNCPSWVSDLFTAIDSKDTAAFVAYLTDDATFRFGSAPAVHGAAAIGAAVGGFFESIRSSTNVLESGPTVVCEGEVTYRRLDDKQITLPFADVLDRQGDRICGYKIYIDIAPLFAA